MHFSEDTIVTEIQLNIDFNCHKKLLSLSKEEICEKLNIKGIKLVKSKPKCCLNGI